MCPRINGQGGPKCFPDHRAHIQAAKRKLRLPTLLKQALQGF